jgi:hypothetical protein
MSDHGHSHEDGDADPPPFADPQVPDAELRPSDLSRRELLRRAGLLGAAAAGAQFLPGFAGLPSARAQGASGHEEAVDDRVTDPDGVLWLAGDHHTHTQYSSDARYLVRTHVGQAARHRIDWLVITDHGRAAHEKVSIDRTLADVIATRAAYPAMLLYQGLEWNIPGAEHGTIFFAPGPNESALLHTFEKSFDGVVVYGAGATKNDPAVEAKAVEGLRWMADQLTAGKAPAGLFLANHPSRRGLDSPHEIRAWNDAAPGIAVGMEGAPGHQASGMAVASDGPEVARGFYDFAPSANSHLAYPLESYRTFGGFDWMTATVGGLWDSLLSEGRRWWITANSDAHAVYRDSIVRGGGTPANYDDPASPYYGAYGDPIDTLVMQKGNGDFWPGAYSRTVVGALARTYADVMAGIGDGRMWVTHGDLIWGLDARLSRLGEDALGVTLGGTFQAERGEDADLRIRITLPKMANFNGDRPKLRRVDVITAPITGRSADHDRFTAPGAAIVGSYDVDVVGKSEIQLRHVFRNVRAPFYVRLRGTDGNASGPGSIEPRLDPVPVDPWKDLWFYSNPIFVSIRP